MMEKYGAEVTRYEVQEVLPFKPDDKKIVGQNLTLDEAIELASTNKHYMIMPQR